jgi:lysophospholipase L1-like esterase
MLMAQGARAVVASALMFVAAAPIASVWAQAQTTLDCGVFTSRAPAAATPRDGPAAVRRFEAINAAVKTAPYRILFLGDSLTEWFDPLVWREQMAPRGVLNAGVSGDRTEHLLWRLQHGNLAGPPPRAVVLLIGTNDLGHGRPPEDAAQGIRANLLFLRRHLPDTRILLLGLWPREALPEAPLRRKIGAVNALIRRCGDNRAIVYADIGDVLLDPSGQLTREVSPDLLHFSHQGYVRLAPRLDALIGELLAAR